MSFCFYKTPGGLISETCKHGRGHTDLVNYAIPAPRAGRDGPSAGLRRLSKKRTNVWS